MEINDLRQVWNSIDIPDPGQETSRVERRVGQCDGRLTIRDRLMRISLRMIAVCAIAVCCILPLGSEHPLMALLVGIFFISMGIMHYIQYRALRSLDVTRMTLRDVLRRVYRIEALRSSRRIIGIVLAIPLMIFMIFTMTRSYGAVMLPACVLGSLAGCVISLIVNRRTTRLLREIKRELGNCF
ncbi:hypothetical protein [uncultured Duncaniella sp.]|jgi:drug/metabolite transporter (DMT)-like permease|uniref:hypothetical protein n=1 Tax=uncultured Duncaniella sp. TaxID=2768039 RepID=UPI0026751D08|nr:hypothetical protein [uncultured Duncaniella sp.]MCI9172014.1 hypothetical protein [Muribaculaceae bacterium]